MEIEPAPIADQGAEAKDKNGIKPGSEKCFEGSGCATLWYGDVGDLWVEASTEKRAPDSLSAVYVLCSQTPDELQSDQMECYSSVGGAWIEHPKSKRKNTPVRRSWEG
jgi:hypothetical protein